MKVLYKMNFSCALHQADRRIIKQSLKFFCGNSIGLKHKYKRGILLKWEHFLCNAHQKPSEEVKVLQDESEWKLLQLIAYYHATTFWNFFFSFINYSPDGSWGFSILSGDDEALTVWEAVLTNLPVILKSSSCAWALYWSLVHKGDKLFSQEVLVPNKAHVSVCPTFLLVRDLGKRFGGFQSWFQNGGM